MHAKSPMLLACIFFRTAFCDPLCVNVRCTDTGLVPSAKADFKEKSTCNRKCFFLVQ